MKQSVISFGKIILGAAAILIASTAFAEWRPMSEADVLASQRDLDIQVQADGSYTVRSEFTLTPQNETARRRFSQFPVVYNPETTKITGLSAESVVGAAHYTLDRHGFGDRDFSGVDGAPIGTRALILPFTRLSDITAVHYTYTAQEAAGVVPGVYNASFIYGISGRPEMAGHVTIHSKAPIAFRADDPDHTLKIEASKIGADHILKITIVKPIYREIKNEGNSMLRSGAVPRVDVSTATSWTQVATPVATAFESKIEQKLPPAFEAIATHAKELKSTKAKIDYVSREVANQIGLTKSWLTDANHFFPRDLEKIATSKVGDSQEIAAMATAVYRRVGFDANVALTYHGFPMSNYAKLPVGGLANAVPSLAYFNYAIVRIPLADEKIAWVDPSQNAAPSNEVFMDIADSAALTLQNPALQREAKLEAVVVEKKQADIHFETSLKDGGDMMVSATGEMVLGSASSPYLKSLLKDSGELAVREALRKFVLYAYKPIGDASVRYNLNADPDSIKVAFAFSAQSPVQSIATVKSAGLGFYPVFVSLRYSSATRVSDLYLGPTGTVTSNIKMRGVDYPDLADSDCYVKSPWFDVKRTVLPAFNGFDVIDTIAQKADHVTTAEMKSEAYEKFEMDINACVATPFIDLQAPVNAAPGDIAGQRLGSPASQLSLKDAIAMIDTKAPGLFASIRKGKHIAEVFLEKDPKDSEARAWRAYAIRQLGYISGQSYEPAYLNDALSEVNLALESDAKFAAGYLIRSQIQLDLDHRTEAIDDFKKAYALDSHDRRVFKLGADVALKYGSKADAETWMTSFVNSATTSDEKASAFAAMGDLYYAMQSYDKSIEYYKRTIELDPKNAWPHHGLALNYRDKQDLDSAIAEEHKSLELSSLASQRMLADLLIAKLDAKAKSRELVPKELKLTAYNEAEPAVNEAVKLQPDYLPIIEKAFAFYRERALLSAQFDDVKRATEFAERLNQVDSLKGAAALAEVRELAVEVTHMTPPIPDGAEKLQTTPSFPIVKQPVPHEEPANEPSSAETPPIAPPAAVVPSSDRRPASL